MGTTPSRVSGCGHSSPSHNPSSQALVTVVSRNLSQWLGTVAGHSPRSQWLGTAPGHSGWAQPQVTVAGHSPRSQWLGTVAGHSPRSQWLGTAPGHSGWAQPQVTVAGHSPRSQQWTECGVLFVVRCVLCASRLMCTGYNAAANMFKGLGGGKQAVSQEGFTYTYMFNKSGTFDYRCFNHPYTMFGQVIVKPAGDETLSKYLSFGSKVEGSGCSAGTLPL